MRVKKLMTVAVAVTCMVGGMVACGSKGGVPKAAANVATSKGFDTSKKISVVSREEGSGMRGAFIELFGVEEKDAQGKKVDHTTKKASITNATSVMMTSVANNKNAIGYISLGALNDTVNAVQINKVDATVENIKNGSYEIARPFNIATKDQVSEVAEDFIAFIMSKEGQQIIVENKYISVAEGAAYAPKQVSGKLVVAGSSSVTPVMEKLKEAYEEINTNVKVEIQESDSTTGVQSTIEGICDIGMASRDLKDSELEKGVKETTIAKDGIAVIVNKENIVKSLTKEQVKNIYVGQVTTWDEAMK